MIENPFESGHIKNYLLLYASIVVIMVLFFIASSLFHDVENVEKKVFDTKVDETLHVEKKKESKEEIPKRKFKLLEVNSDGYIKYNKGSEVNTPNEPN